ncbi:MAG: hypothetical protein RDV48_06970 [Candidatus Eremiobacteraeota bacterium]|nr:hypothetical protein [Candidatus Eremiobacteraeota bacterium]
MKEYDSLGHLWLPYVMYFHTPNYRSPIVNTDSYGFRFSIKSGEVIKDFETGSEESFSLLVGGSTAFGIGATSDKTTIPSLLNNSTGMLWLNYGGRAFGSTQEFIMFMLTHKHINRINKVLLFSGLNNLILFYLSNEYSKEFGSFFFWNHYNNSMNLSSNLSPRRRVLKRMLSPFLKDTIDYQRIGLQDIIYLIKNRRLPEKKVQSNVSYFETISNHEEEKQKIFFSWEKDLANWKLMSEALKFDLIYILQPMANWVKENFCLEEKKIFEELDRHPANHWKIISHKMGNERYEWLKLNIENICNTNNIRFFDMNEALKKHNIDEKWLFVDRAHLTDEGNRIVADIIKEEILG